MHRQPNGRPIGVRPFDAMFGMCRKLNVISGPKRGNKKAEEEFKNVSVAYDLLGDTDKRARFDRGEIDASVGERPEHRYYRDFAEPARRIPTRPTRASRTLPARTMFCRKSSGAAGAPTCACEGRMCIIASNSTSSMQSM